jgi:hypothetical protein
MLKAAKLRAPAAASSERSLPPTPTPPASAAAGASPLSVARLPFARGSNGPWLLGSARNVRR